MSPSDILHLFEEETPLFVAYRWRAYQVGTSIVMLAFDGQLGYLRDNHRGWEYKHTVSNLSEAVETLISIYTGRDGS